MTDLSRIDVIAPNFKRRHSGVTSTVVRLVPLQAAKIAITCCAPVMPDHVPNTAWRNLLSMSRLGPSGARVWHARRNVEMIGGLALKFLLGKHLRLLFTSDAQRYHKPLTRWLIRRQDAVIAGCANAAQFLERQAIIIPHGVDCAQFQPTQDKDALRDALDLPQGTLIGCFGRIRHQKGNDLFIDTMLRTLPDHPDAYALMMGRATAENQDYLNTLKSRVAEAGLSNRVIFRDEVPMKDLAAHFQALDLYIAPQRWEGFGLTPLEAMACGAPTIATRVGAFEDIVKDGETGVLVDVEDVDAMVSAAHDLLSDPAKLAAWGKTARQHVVDHFTLEREADAIIAVYRDLLNG